MVTLHPVDLVPGSAGVIPESVYLTHRIHGTGIFPYIGLIFMVNVGIYIYIPYMDPMGKEVPVFWREIPIVEKLLW